MNKKTKLFKINLLIFSFLTLKNITNEIAPLDSAIKNFKNEIKENSKYPDCDKRNEESIKNFLKKFDPEHLEYKERQTNFSQKNSCSLNPNFETCKSCYLKPDYINNQLLAICKYNKDEKTNIIYDLNEIIENIKNKYTKHKTI